MASHQIAIAKASFSAGLLRPDPTSVPRDDISLFHLLLDRALSHCSFANIQTCKSWLLKNVVQSSNRAVALGKYLVVMSESFKDSDERSNRPLNFPPEISGKRRRLHMLYLLNDVFHHTKYHSDASIAFTTFSVSLQPYIIDLIACAASYDRDKNPRHYRRLDILLDLWEQNGYYNPEYIKKLHEAVRHSGSVDAIKASVGIKDQPTDSQKTQTPRDVPFVMPATHGDLSTPFYDLPAGNFVPHIIPNSPTAIRPDAVKPMQFPAGPADEKLVVALKTFLKDVDRIYGSEELPHDENAVVDIDELGQQVVRDEITGEIIDSDTYYGWSRTFCQQMKKRQGMNDFESLSRSRSWSRGRSQSPRKRRRYSDDSLSNASRSRPAWRPGSRSYSRERRPRRRYDSGSQLRSTSRASDRADRSRSRSKSRSPSNSRARSYSPQPASPRSFPPRHAYPAFRSVPQPPPPPPPPPPPAPHQSHQFAYNGGQQYNPIPPPPPSYHGPWPPPPPPLPTGNFPPHMNMNMDAGMAMPGYTPLLPPQGAQYHPLPGQGQHMPLGPYHQAPWGQPGGRGGYQPGGRGGWR
ncbi:hypothetical protein Egran_03550 [Elaphomyces granulatus]|uniref:CID domain-containing protein n=1 Tax=Elaphomyces granulatus TaxID=519963 RepID=A0A232LX07_9EURO|nr:hypothetical protein Egran_03550 [Elaphomyces granulatus]